MFQPASKKKLKLRLALYGSSGSGKTYTALAIASHLGASPQIALIDTEHGSASLYSDKFKFDVVELGSDPNDTEPFAPEKYVVAIKAAERAGYDVLVIDSLSHAWSGLGGILDTVDKKKAQGGNQFAPWAAATPRQNAFIEAIISADLHIIVTMRSTSEYVIQEVANSQGKLVQKPTKVGLKPIQRDGVDFEFSITGLIDQEHVLHIDKTRCDLIDGKEYKYAGQELATTLMEWLGKGEDKVDVKKQQDREERKRLEETITALLDHAFFTDEQRDKALAWMATFPDLPTMRQAFVKYNEALQRHITNNQQ